MNHCIACVRAHPFLCLSFFFPSCCLLSWPRTAAWRARPFILPASAAAVSSQAPSMRHGPRPTGRAVAGLADDVGATLRLGSQIAYRFPWRHSRHLGSSTSRILKQAAMPISLLRTNRRLATRAAGGGKGLAGPARTTRVGLPPRRYPVLLLLGGATPTVAGASGVTLHHTMPAGGRMTATHQSPGQGAASWRAGPGLGAAAAQVLAGELAIRRPSCR